MARTRPPCSSGRVGSGFFRAGWVGLFGSGDPCPGLLEGKEQACVRAEDQEPGEVMHEIKLEVELQKGRVILVFYALLFIFSSGETTLLCNINYVKYYPCFSSLK